MAIQQNNPQTCIEWQPCIFIRPRCRRWRFSCPVPIKRLGKRIKREHFQITREYLRTLSTSRQTLGKRVETRVQAKWPAGGGNCVSLICDLCLLILLYLHVSLQLLYCDSWPDTLWSDTWYLIFWYLILVSYLIVKHGLIFSTLENILWKLDLHLQMYQMWLYVVSDLWFALTPDLTTCSKFHLLPSPSLLDLLLYIVMVPSQILTISTESLVES